MLSPTTDDNYTTCMLVEKNELFWSRYSRIGGRRIVFLDLPNDLTAAS